MPPSAPVCAVWVFFWPPRASGDLGLHLPPEVPHPANRPRHPGSRGSELILQISEPAHEGARFSANQRLLIQAVDDRPDIQLMHLGELPRPQLVIRVIPGPVVPGAQGNGGQVRRLLAQAVRPGMGRLDRTRRVAHRTGKRPDPFEVSGMAHWFHLQLLRNECRPMARPAPGASTPPSTAALIERLSTLTSGLFTCPRTAARCSISSPSSNCSHVIAGNFRMSTLYSAGMADSSATSTDGGQARRLKVVVFPSSLRYFPLPSVPRCSIVPIT